MRMYSTVGTGNSRAKYIIEVKDDFEVFHLGSLRKQILFRFFILFCFVFGLLFLFVWVVMTICLKQMCKHSFLSKWE